MVHLFCIDCLKTNEHVEKSFMVGILKLTKASWLSGLNNIEVRAPYLLSIHPQPTSRFFRWMQTTLAMEIPFCSQSRKSKSFLTRLMWVLVRSATLRSLNDRAVSLPCN
jgi:hypothetical protein